MDPIIAIVDAVKTYHTQVFTLDKINVEYQLMTATEGGHSLSKEKCVWFLLKAIRDGQLHLVGQQEVVLFCL